MEENPPANRVGVTSADGAINDFRICGSMGINPTAKAKGSCRIICGITGDGAITYYGVTAAYKESSPVASGSIAGNVAFGEDGIGIVKINPSSIPVVASVIGYAAVDEGWIGVQGVNSAAVAT